MRILCDIDDTIENLLDTWIAELNENYGTSVSTADIVEWDMCGFFPSLTREQIYNQVKAEGFWARVKPKEDAITYLKKLTDDGHEIYLCTATDWIDIRPKYEDLLRVYFPFIDWAHIIVCSNKQLIKGDVMIDDREFNLLGGDYFKILYTQPHNKNFDAEKSGIVRVSNWEEIYKVITDLNLTKNDKN